MKILALDPGTTTGWAVGSPGETPVWGARNLGVGKSSGQVISVFRAWLNTIIYQEKPSLIAFEAPYIARAGAAKPGGPPPQNAMVLRRLLALVGQIEAIAFELRIEVCESPTQEFCKYFTGKGRWPGGRDEKKRQTILACHRYGWLDVSEDSADALSLLAFAESIIAPEIASRRRAGAGEELPLYGTLNAPAQARIGRRVLS
jgi:hypothetical protein